MGAKLLPAARAFSQRTLQRTSSCSPHDQPLIEVAMPMHPICAPHSPRPGYGGVSLPDLEFPCFEAVIDQTAGFPARAGIQQMLLG